RSAVPADVDEGALLPVGALDQDNRHLARPARLDVALTEAADVVPGASEDRFLLAREHRRIPVPVPGDRVHSGHLAGTRSGRHDASVVNSGDVQQLIYRDEVLGILGALADLVVAVRAIQRVLEEDGEEEEEKGGAWGVSPGGGEHAERSPTARTRRERLGRTRGAAPRGGSRRARRLVSRPHRQSRHGAAE